MANTVVIKALEKQFAKLLGTYLTAEKAIEEVRGVTAIAQATAEIDGRKAEIKTSMGHIEAVLRMFDADWTSSRVTPIFPTNRSGGYADISRWAFRAMQEAGRPLSAREMTHYIADKQGLGKIDAREATRLDVAVFGAMDRAIGRGIYLHPGKPKRWAPFPPDDLAD